MTRKSLLIRWTVGLFVGTMLVWLSSPLFVRSYHAKVFDPLCRSWVYPTNTTYRWRNEGYATTVFGPHGMPGRRSLPDTSAQRVIALWGDSQAEGVTLADDRKLWITLQRSLATGTPKSAAVEVLPMAHSGEDAVDWLRRFASVEAQLGVDEHFILVCELDDLAALSDPIPDPVSELRGVNGDAALDIVPDFVIHAARGLIFDGDSLRLRKLRFGLGPIADRHAKQTLTPEVVRPLEIATIAATLADTTDKPITVIYAPRLPMLIGDQVFRDDPRASDFQSLAAALAQRGIRVVDCRDALRDAADQGTFPHGFHNGVFGNGHLNAIGYQVIAHAVSTARLARGIGF